MSRSLSGFYFSIRNKPADNTSVKHKPAYCVISAISLTANAVYIFQERICGYIADRVCHPISLFQSPFTCCIQTQDNSTWQNDDGKKVDMQG